MSRALPALRRDLDVMLSPVRDRPGLLVRDPFRYAEDVLIIPPPLVPFLRLFDGRHVQADLETALAHATGESGIEDVVRHLVDSLDRGFLESDAYRQRRDARHEDFAGAPRRGAVHAGAAYPEEEQALERWLENGMGARVDAPLPDEPLVGLAAPHVSPDGGWRSYAAAYKALPPRDGVRTVVVLGTSHYGEPETFGLTRKPYVTPLGEAGTDQDVVDRLARDGGAAVRMEDYCHAVEHSIEFQVVFLQHVWGRDVAIVPVLCGPFARATHEGRPEDDPGVARFLDGLRTLAARERGRLLWVLGVDLAHVGRRYGDETKARAGQGGLREVARRDRERLDRVAEGDAEGFWRLLREGGDDLRWCGASPLYSFLRAAGPVRGDVLEYEQWNIDPESVVSFAAVAFRGGPASPGKGDA